MRLLPLPGFYQPRRAADWTYRPDAEELRQAALSWRREHGIAASGSDPRHVRLLLIDAQRDFCFPEGTLYVGGRSGRGALEDNDRIARFVYRNLDALSEITCTLDTHYPFQIFFASFWEDASGQPLGAHREITADQVRSGAVRPRRSLASWLGGGGEAWLNRQAEFYCAELERAGKYRLYLWPPHCLLGGDGHSLAGVVQEARLFHAYARDARNGIELKGGHPLTENYSALSPEVLGRHDGGDLAGRNDALVGELLRSDALVVAGQALSHCVKSSLDDLLAEIQSRDASLAGRVYILTDAMSSVAVPDTSRPGELLFDFTPQGEDALLRYRAAGMHLVHSTTPMEAWPGL